MAALYNDALNGVVIDWDGVCHDERKEHIYDTENEVDVIVMHDAVPVFISCKAGSVSTSALNEIKTLASREDVDTIVNAGDADREGEIIIRICVEKALNIKVKIINTDGASLIDALANINKRK